MATKKNKKSSSSEYRGLTDLVGEEEAAEIDEEVARLDNARDQEPVQPPVDTRRRVTVREHFRGNRDPLVVAFLHVEGLAPRVRKQLPEEWDSEFKTFCTAERR